MNSLGNLPILGKLFQGPPFGIGVLTASFVLAIMVIPFISAVMRDVFETVPDVLKESAYGLGATTWEVIWKVVVPYRFRQPPQITANGVYQFRGGKNTRLEIKVDGSSGMDYMFLGKTLPFDHVAARLLFTNDRLQINDVRADLLDGTLRGNADISLARNDPRYRASLSISEINFPRLTDLYFNYKTSQGLLRGTYEFNGLGNDWRTMRGKGKVEVSNGDVFAIPIFGPLSGILNHIVPGKRSPAP